MLMFEGYGLARPYYEWDKNDHRIEVLRDLDYELNFVRAAVQVGVAPYLGGTWPQLIADAPNDAEWRLLVDAYDAALRYWRDVLSARLRVEGLPDAVWIVPTHLMFARFYDDGLAGRLPAGITSHRDMHALDDYYTNRAGNHPYMVNPLSAYCSWCMIREVVMGADASDMAPWPVDGVTDEIAAYLRGLAVDIARSAPSRAISHLSLLSRRLSLGRVLPPLGLTGRLLRRRRPARWTMAARS